MPRSQTGSQTPGFIYFIGSAHPASPIKIGWSTNPYFRLSKLRTGHPEELEVLATVAGSKDDERYIHSTFRYIQTRHAGEWFARNAAIMRLIDAVLRKVPFPERWMWLDGRQTYDDHIAALAQSAIKRLSPNGRGRRGTDLV